MAHSCRIYAYLVLVCWLHPAIGGPADVVEVKVTAQTEGSYRFDVTLLHADEGWDHYANQWEVVAPGGQVLGTRVLYHPHVHEQPFTRSLSGVKVPADVDFVEVRARDSVHGLGGRSVRVELPR